MGGSNSGFCLRWLAGPAFLAAFLGLGCSADGATGGAGTPLQPGTMGTAGAAAIGPGTPAGDPTGTTALPTGSPPATGGNAGSAPSPMDALDASAPLTPPDATPTEPGEPCSGKPGAPGTNMRSVMNGTLNRTFLVHVPPTVDPNAPVPILFAHHGFTMTGQTMHDLTGFEAVADREGFVAVFPDGGGAAPWNVGTGICGVGAFVGGTEDDLGFVEKMLDDIAEDQCIDRTHVFLTGFSMGGYFANHVGCQKSDLVRAVAPHSGGTYAADCPGGPIPVLLLHGTGDALISPMCGTQARDLWVQRNGCSTDFDMVPVMGGHCERHKGCPEHGQVTLCLFDGMAHGWAGASQQGATGFYGGGQQFENATELVWKFFSEQ